MLYKVLPSVRAEQGHVTKLGWSRVELGEGGD